MIGLNQQMAAMAIPLRMRHLPISPNGYPVPWFVQYFDAGQPSNFGQGVPDFRVADERKLSKAIKHRRCWLCGETLGVRMCFVIGPMCAVNRVTSEPPCHRECAEFAAMACPFLTRPKMRRNDRGLPEQRKEPAGFHLDRNPGATCLWTTRTYSLFRPRAGGKGVLFSLGKPESVDWFCEARRASRADVMASIDSGYPLLREVAEREGPEAISALERQLSIAMGLLPPEVAL